LAAPAPRSGPSRRSLNSVAQPLLLVSAALLAVTSLRCSRLAVASAASSGVLLYLGMYVITRRDGTATPLLFYPGPPPRISESTVT